jgi:hypothetical protein
MEKELLCRTCKICLTDENKVTKENICKSCNKIKHNEWRERKNNGLPLIKKVHTHYKKLKQFATENNINIKLEKYKTYFNKLQ